jgi:xylulokinase
MEKSEYLLGIDAGSSSIKATILNTDTGHAVSYSSPSDKEMKIDSPKKEWAEQDPEMWWHHTINAVQNVLEKSAIKPASVKAIGISYQMHGLVIVNRKKEVLRPSIIWCDSRATHIGNEAFQMLGAEKCLGSYLNSPGNFTASKLRWVQENEPQVYQQIYKLMLPGDYLSMKITGSINTTHTGLSEGIFWDYSQNGIAHDLLSAYDISEDLLPDYHESFHEHGTVTKAAAAILGLREGTPVTYKAGDQPNNALSLNVMRPGEVATTAGTSGVIYGVISQPVYDEKSRVNTFIHVNHKPAMERYGVLLCINGTGILNRWLRENITGEQPLSYEKMNVLASQVPAGSDGLSIFPFGNGSERLLENRLPGAMIRDLHFNRHSSSHILRAAQEGIVFSMMMGLEVMNRLGINPNKIKAGHSNMFLSPVFRDIFVNTTGASLELFETDGSAGAARGAGLGAGIFASSDEAFRSLKSVKSIDPSHEKQEMYSEIYHNWKKKLQSELN